MQVGDQSMIGETSDNRKFKFNLIKFIVISLLRMGKECLDLFQRIGNMRWEDRLRILEDFDKAFKEDRELATVRVSGQARPHAELRSETGAALAPLAARERAPKGALLGGQPVRGGDQVWQSGAALCEALITLPRRLWHGQRSCRE